MDFLHSHLVEVVLGCMLALEQYLADSKVIEANSSWQIVKGMVKGLKDFLFPPK